MARPDKQMINFVLEGIGLAVFMALVATGFAMEFTMRGRGGQMTQMGLSRHDASEIHLVLGIVFLVIVFLHVALHWRWVWSYAKGQNPKTRSIRAAAFLAALFLLLAIGVLPWIVPARQAAGGRGGPAMISPPAR